MAPVSEGADTTRLDQIAGGLRANAHATRTVGVTGSQLVTVLAESWMGPDMEHFAAEWSVARPRIDAAADMLSRLEQELQRQAADQERTSSRAGGGGGAGSGGPGPRSAATDGSPEPHRDGDGPMERPGSVFDRMRGVLESVGLWGDDPVTEVPEDKRPDDPGVDGVTLPAGADPDDPLVQELMASPRGRETLQWMADNDVTLAPAEGSGTYYDPESNTMYIASSADGSSAIHEASHAQWDAEGTRADATKVSQEDYVRSQIDNEVDATTEGIYYDKEMRMRGYPIERSTTEINYDTAYTEAIDAGKTPEEADAAGRERVREMFVAGEDGAVEFETSTTGEGYEEYYADQWQDVREDAGEGG